MPLSVMLPVLVRLLATKVTLPVADTPPLPTVNGLLAVMLICPPVALTAFWVTMPPVLVTVMPPLAVVSWTMFSAPVLSRSTWPVPVTMPEKLLIWLPGLTKLMPVCDCTFNKPGVSKAPPWEMLPVGAERVIPDAVIDPTLRFPLVWAITTGPLRLILPPLWLKLPPTLSEPPPFNTPPLWLKPAVVSAPDIDKVPLAMPRLPLLESVCRLVAPGRS